MILEQTLLQFGLDSGISGFMNSAWGWPIVESLHFSGLSLLAGTIALFDLRLLGAFKSVSHRGMQQLIPLGVAGFALNVLTGTMFLVTAPDQYLYNPAFLSKIVLIFLAGLNVTAFYRFCYPGQENPDQYPRRAIILAGLSLVIWCSVIVAGRLITWFRPPYHWCLLCS